jgi:hypothetical protein
MMPTTLGMRLRLLAAAFVLLVPRAAAAQSDQFGGTSRANAAAQMVVLAVQQGISSLPPTSGQSFEYEYDPSIYTYVRGSSLGPNSLRSALTIGEGVLSLRGALSYFSLSRNFAPIVYSVRDSGGQLVGYTKFGLNASASVGLLNVAATYGITHWLETSINVPVVLVDTDASQVFVTTATNPNFIVASPTVEGLNDALDDEFFVLRTQPYSRLFNVGTHVGLGRVSVALKEAVLSGDWWRVALSQELFMPSPNQDQFAGSDSTAILPRAIAALDLAEWATLHADVGYDYDFEVAELRRFTWNIGPSFSIPDATFDLGLGGSDFAKAIRWTPTDTTFAGSDGFQSLSLHAEEDNTLGTDYVDFLAGFKVRLAVDTVLSGTVNVPLTDNGFRPAAVGTVAVEQYF